MPEGDDLEAPWSQYRRLVIQELDSLRKSMDDMRRSFDTFRSSEMSSVKVELALLKQKAAWIGGVVGLFAGGVTSFIVVLLTK